jgi:hypothetical protein
MSSTKVRQTDSVFLCEYSREFWAICQRFAHNSDLPECATMLHGTKYPTRTWDRGESVRLELGGNAQFCYDGTIIPETNCTLC